VGVAGMIPAFAGLELDPTWRHDAMIVCKWLSGHRGIKHACF
jgi:hypothetical protein